MPISFNPEDYKARFNGEVTYSKVLPMPTDPNREVWNVHIANLKNNGGTWEKIPATQACGIQGCQEMVIHRHNFLYENPRPGSPIARFVMDLKSNCSVQLTEPTQLEGMRFEFEEEKVKAGTNPQTGAQGKDRTYYFPVGQIRGETDHEQESIADLPWEAPTNGTAAPAIAVANSTSAPMADSDLVDLVIAMADGKSREETRSACKAIPEIYDRKAFLIRVFNNTIFDELIGAGRITQDAEGKLHKV